MNNFHFTSPFCPQHFLHSLDVGQRQKVDCSVEPRDFIVNGKRIELPQLSHIAVAKEDEGDVFLHDSDRKNLGLFRDAPHELDDPVIDLEVDSGVGRRGHELGDGVADLLH